MTGYPLVPRPLAGDDAAVRALERALVTPHEFGPYVARLPSEPNMRSRNGPVPDFLLVRVLLHGWGDLNPTEEVMWSGHLGLLFLLFQEIQHPNYRGPWQAVRRRERTRDLELACVSQPAFLWYASAMAKQYPDCQGGERLIAADVARCVTDGFDHLPDERFELLRRNGCLPALIVTRLLPLEPEPAHWQAVRQREGIGSRDMHHGCVV